MNLSYNKKRLQRLPQIQGSNINLSINNTYVVIKNQTPDNYSFIQKDILPNIFSYNQKKKEKKLPQIKKFKKQLTPNIKSFDFMLTNTTNNVIKEQKSSDDFILTNKLLNRLLWFFNIRELLILMNINKKTNTFIKNTPMFQKYLNIRKDFKNGNLFLNLNNNGLFNKRIINLKNSLFKSSNNNIKIQIDTESNNYFINNNNDKKNIDTNSFIKFNLLNKKKVKLKKVLNPDIYQLSQISLNSNEINNDISEIQKYKKENTNIQINNSNINIFSHNNPIDSLNNSLFSSGTHSSKNELQSKIEDNSNISNEVLKFDKIKSNFLSLIKNKGSKMKLFMKKYKLNYTESKIIMNGIIESIILKKQKYENKKNKNNNFFSSLALKDIKADKYMIYYFDPILNLDLDDLTKISFDNIIISSMNIMKKICHLLWRNFTSIKILSLQNNDINDNCAQILFQNLRFNKAITILNLSHNKISNQSIIYSDLFFISNKSLNTLVISYNYLGSKGCINLMNFLKYNQKLILRTLDISYNGISEEGMLPIFKYIKANKKLLSLFFSGNCLGNSGLELFVNSIFDQDSVDVSNSNSKISYLDLSNNNLTKESCKYINNILCLSPFITNINVGYNSLYNEGVNSIFDCLNEKSNLISLDLTQTNISEKCIEFIAEKIDKTISLRILNLSFNNLGKACIYLKQLLLKETNIKVLKLSSCKLSSNINMIFQGLCKNCNIETFDLSDNNIIMNQNNLSDILCFFQENKKILNLILDSTNINDIGLNYIMKGIEHNRTVKKLSLKNNLISNETFELLINSLQKNEIIRKIDLEGNCISQKYREKIYSVVSSKLNKGKLIK